MLWSILLTFDLMIISRLKAIFVLLLLLVAKLHAQNPYHYVIDRSKGLPSNSVYDIFQDSKGYMWFATDEGICRYDGTKFTSFYTEEQTSRAGSSVTQDKYGRIWYSNFDGYLYYVYNGTLHPLANKNPRGYFKYGVAGDFLYVVSQQGVAIYQLKTLRLLKNITISDNTISSANLIDGKFYVVGNFLYVIANGKLEKQLPFPHKKNAINVHPIIIQRSQNGVFFISKNINSQYLLNKDGKFVSDNRPSEINFVQNVSTTTDGLWLCSTKGAYLSNLNGTYKNYFANYNISYVFKDDRSNYWFSSVNKGLLLVPDITNKLLEMPVRPIRVNAYQNKLIVSTEDDFLYSINLKNSNKQVFHKGKSNHAINQLYVDSLSGDVIFSSNTFNVISKINTNIKDAGIAIKDVDKIDGKYYSYAASGSFGMFKLNNHKEVSVWDTIYNSRKHHIHGFEQASLRYHVNAKSTAYNPLSKTIYYATNLGIFYVSLNGSGEIKAKGNSLYIKNIVSYKGLIFALATSGRLYQITGRHTAFPVSLSDQFAIKGVYRISKTEDLMIIYAISGIYCYNMLEKKIGKISNDFQDFEITDVIEVGGKLVMATSKGLLVDNKLGAKTDDAKRFMVEDVTVNNKKLTEAQLLNLSYQQRNIEINYALLAYAPKEKADIYYTINGDKWQPLAQSGSLKLSSLSPGTYQLVFKVGAKVSSEKVKFKINKPLWFSYWFIGLVVLIAIITGYLLSKYKIAQNNKRNQYKLDRLSLESNLNRSKLKAIKSQMNPHFFYNALNTIQSFILANENKQAVSYLSKFANLTRTILEMSEKDEVLLTEEIKTIGLYLDIEKARFDSDFNYSIKKIGISETDDIKIPSMLLQPYLENAVKHGLLHKEGQKELKVIFEMAENELLVTIEDNGIGRKRSMELNEIKQQKHKSFATAAIQSRIELLNLNKKNKIVICYQDKVGANQQPAGTLVVIQLPLNED